jgi:uncharacterized RDD family membrane protein YckC
VTRPAGFWIRFGAALLDSIIIGVPLAVLSFFIKGNWEGDFFTSTLDLLYYIIVPVIWAGYTVGKKITGIRIVKVNGEKLGIGAMLMRTLVAGIVYVITIGLGLIVSAFMVGLRSDKRALHDLIAGTYVTYEKPNEKSIENL